MKAKKIIFTILIIGVIVASFFIIDSSFQKDEEIINNDLVSVKIGYSRLRISLPVFVAQEKGFFKKNGLDVELKMYETAQPLMQSLLAGNVNVAGYTALPITYNGMLRSEKQLYFISAMMEDENHRISYLLKSTDKTREPIESISDLKGKRIGILPTVAYQAWIEEILRRNNIDPVNDVKIEKIAPTLQGQALINGAVDVLFTNDPAATSMLQKQIAEFVTTEVEVPKYLGSPFTFGSFNIDKEWADDNQDVYKKVIKSLNEAIDYVNNNPEESKQTMIPYLPSVFKDDVKFYPNALYLKSDKCDETMFQEVSDLYLKIGIIKKPLNLSGLIE